jgi:hypothetical protein
VVLGESDGGDRAHGERWDVAAYRCGGGKRMVVQGELVQRGLVVVPCRAAT